MRFAIWVAVNALALGAAVWLVEGIDLTARGAEDQLVTILLVALIFGVVNAVVRPVVKLLALPLIVLTLGLLIFVINALMLMLTGFVSDQAGLGFDVQGFWPAVWGALVVTVATWLLELVLPDGRRERW